MAHLNHYLPPMEALAPSQEENNHFLVVNEAYNGHVEKLDTSDGRDGSSNQEKRIMRGHWRPFEDEKLKNLVAQYGPKNWDRIVEKLGGRSGKSCRLRWLNQLDPQLNWSTFSKEEEALLVEAHRAYGTKWSLIARHFPGRTDNAVKNHWHVMMARKSRAIRDSNHSSSYPSSSTPGLSHFMPTVGIYHHNNNGMHSQLNMPVEVVTATHVYGANEFDNSSSINNTHIYLEGGSNMDLHGNTPKPVKFTPSAHSAFSTPSLAVDKGGDKSTMVFFDFLSVGHT